MKISFNWLKDFVNIKTSPKALAQKLTMAGLEVGSLEEKGADSVFEIEITANRPDCLSVLGIAQEVAAILNLKLKTKNSKLKVKISKSKDKLTKNFISIQDKKDCAFYRGCLITDVKVGPSPEWLRKRIEAVGIRPVNNIVDITNYCLLEFGQPLHAFDYQTIVEKIVVRRAKRGEKILTIDGTERELSENILVISDRNKAIAIAGIMGDKLSEVGPQTKNIFLESAYFDPIIIRRASRELGLSSDSSYRFERGVAFQRVKLAQDRAVKLISEIAGGKLADERGVGLKIKPKAQEIKFDCAKAGNLLSLDVSIDRAKKIFSCLGFSSKKLAKETLSVRIPASRSDIKLEQGLLEEFARTYGYNNIPSTLPSIRSAKIDNSEQETIKPLIRDIASALGFNEAINYSLQSKDMLEKASVNREALRLSNPLSSEQEYLRPTLIVGLLNCLAYNLNRKNMDLKLFELGHVFDSDYSEYLSLGLIATGKFIDNWQIKKEFDFFHLKAGTQNIIERLGFSGVKFSSAENNNLFFNNEAAKIICQDKEVGIQGRIDNRILLNFGIKNAPPVFYAEIFLKELLECRRRSQRFVPLPVFPSIVRDLSLIARNSVSYEQISDIVIKEAGRYLKNIKLVDIYKGEQIPAGCKGLTISLEFALPDRTLTDDQATKAQEEITRRLKAELGISIR